MNRRSFLYLGTAFIAGCAAPGGGGPSSGGKPRSVNLGPAGQYLRDGVYTRFRDKGIFVVRHGADLFAISAICTHRKCKLDAEEDRTFYCPCHGSTFDAAGHVTTGPAKRDLPVFAMSTNPDGDLIVMMP